MKTQSSPTVTRASEFAQATRNVSLFAGEPPATGVLPGRVIVVEAAAELPVALDALRRIVAELGRQADSARAAIDTVAMRHQPEWNWLFPGSFATARALIDLAGSPSERRLHAESEQIFRVLDVAAQAATEAVAGLEEPVTMVIRGAGSADVVSLRGLGRLIERAQVRGVELQLVVADVAEHSRLASPCEERLGRRLRAAALQPLGAVQPSPARAVAGIARAGTWTLPVEAVLLRDALQSTEAVEGIAAGLLAMRTTFFSTNYESSLRAAKAVLDRLERGGDSLDCDALHARFMQRDPGDSTPALGIEAEHLSSRTAIATIAQRYLGAVHVLMLQYGTAARWFERAHAGAPDPVAAARVALLWALLDIKRRGDPEAGIARIGRSLEALDGSDTSPAAVERAWLHNLRALASFQRRDAASALADENHAVRLIGRLHTADATHLKINLVSNISVLQEAGRRYEDAAATWRRFQNVNGSWGANFTKHHRYRAAGLSYKAGDAAAALREFQVAYVSAVEVGDRLHQQAIALEVGTMLLDGGHDDAAEWFERAAAAATALGDPFHLALARAAVAMARSESLEVETLTRLAGASLTYPDRGEELERALLAEDPAQIAALLPRPRTKLNRPFDLVRLELVPA